MHFDYSEEIL